MFINVNAGVQFNNEQNKYKLENCWFSKHNGKL